MKWSYGEVLGGKKYHVHQGDLILRVTDFLYCGCFKLFCNVWVCICMGFCNVWVVLVICVLVFTVFSIVCTLFFVLFRLCILILICSVCTSVRTTATE